MISGEQLEAFSEIVSEAQAEFNQALANGSSNDAGLWCEQMDNVAFAAEMAEVKGLDRVCQAMSEQLAGQSDETQLKQLVEWTGHVLAFLRRPQDADLAQLLVCFLPDPLQQELLAELLAELFNEQQDLDDTGASTEVQLHTAVDSANDSYFFELQQQMLEELGKVAGVLGKILDEMFGSATKSAFEVLQSRYSEGVVRLLQTAQRTELVGLAKVCQWVLINTESLTMGWLQKNRTHSHLVFRQWPVLVMSYLAEPNNDEHYIALLNHLELAGWPNPIDEKGSRELLEALLQCRSAVAGELDTSVARVAGPQDMSLQLAADMSPSLLDAFLHDAPEQATQLARCICELQPHQNADHAIAQAQRLTHTLKGAANVTGIPAIANMAHVMEDVFERLSQQKRILDDELIVLLQSAADAIESMVDFLQGKDKPPADLHTLYQALIEWLNVPAPFAAAKSASRVARIESFAPEPDSESVPESASQYVLETEHDNDAVETTQPALSTEYVRVPLSVINGLFQLAEEITIALGATQEQTHRIVNQLQDMQLQDRRVQEHRFELENAVDVRAAANRQRGPAARALPDGDFDSLEMDRYDEVTDVAHGLIESVADARELSQEVQSNIRILDGMLLQQNRLNKELQKLVKNTRLIPVDSILPRLQRCIRHACRITGKQIEFQISGTDAEINEETLDTLVDPIMHLLRNAVDHGIEDCDVRQQLGKPIAGQVVLSFAQDGQHIRIKCEDDGAGIDALRVREKATQKGLIQTGDVLSEAQLHQLILTPGFSTKDNTNQVSGRGIGMDAVAQSIRSLGGQLNIQERSGGGTCFTIKIPLQMVATHALLVQLNSQLYAIPTHQLDQILAPQAATMTHLGDRPAVSFESVIYPAHHLGHMLGQRSKENSEQWYQQPILVTQNTQQPSAICVDAVVANLDLVIKSTGEYVQNVPGIAGVSILGDGRLIPVLDLHALLERNQPLFNGGRVITENADLIAKNQVLIVDDSLSVRKSLSQLVRDAGYDCDTARDGLDAWDKILNRVPAMILVDMEMPRLNGIELTSRIRSHDFCRHIPVMMITSRSTTKHRDAANKAGVTEYFTKPFAEMDLLDRIHGYLEHSGASSHVSAGAH